jgi:hypothetical protein
VELAGSEALVTAAQRHLDAGRAVEALQLTDVVLAAVPDEIAARHVALEAHQLLLESTDNFWEQAWLRRSITKLSRP